MVLERRHLWECADCGHQASVTAGTVLHGTRTPLTLWFWGAYLVATHTPGISAVQLKRQLGLSRHETAWLMLQKLRRAMVAPEREPLKREVEVDEFFVGGIEEGTHGARQRGEKSLCAGAIEVRGERARAGFGCGWSPTPLPARSAASSRPASSAGRSCGPTAGPATPACADSARSPSAQLARATRGGLRNLVPRLHRAVSNLKSWLRGTHRGVSSDHLQVYLDEFVRHEALSDRVGCKAPPPGCCSGPVKLRAA